MEKKKTKIVIEKFREGKAGQRSITGPKNAKEQLLSEYWLVGNSEAIELINAAIDDFNEKNEEVLVETGNFRATVDFDKESNLVEILLLEKKREWIVDLSKKKKEES